MTAAGQTTARQVEDPGEAADARPPRRHVSGRDFAPGAAVLGGPVGLRAAGAPWWICCVLAALGAGTVYLHIMFPQDSPDKLAWWRDRLTKRRSREASEPERLPSEDSAGTRP